MKSDSENVPTLVPLHCLHTKWWEKNSEELATTWKAMQCPALGEEQCQSCGWSTAFQCRPLRDITAQCWVLFLHPQILEWCICFKRSSLALIHNGQNQKEKRKGRHYLQCNRQVVRMTGLKILIICIGHLLQFHACHCHNTHIFSLSVSWPASPVKSDLEH